MKRKLQHIRVLGRDLPLSELQVNMSNALTRSAHSLNLSEKRIIAASIAKTDQMPNMEDVKQRGGWLVRLSATDYAETFDVDIDTAYTQLQAGAENLFKRYITTTRQTKKGPVVYRFVWVGGVKYHHGEGWIELDWFHEVVPHLFNLKSDFTKYKLKQACALRSVYSWRLFELMQSWQDTGRYETSIEDFYVAMEVPESYQKNFRETRRRVIEPAVEELTQKNNLIINWSTHNAGRKVIGLSFKFKPNPQQSLLQEFQGDE